MATVEPQVTLRSYDSLERLSGQQRFDGKLTVYGYDTKGNRTLVSDYLGVATTYSFDALDRLKTAVVPEGATTYVYFPDGLLRQVVGFNGVNEVRCYDNAGQLSAIVSGTGAVPSNCGLPAVPLSRFEYDFDANGNRVEQREARGAALPEVTDYGFDELDRLVATRYPVEAMLYSLDAVGNRVGERKALSSNVLALTVAAFAALAPADTLASTAATFNRVDWLSSRNDLTAGVVTTYTFDAAGNRTDETAGITNRHFVFDIRNTLTVAVSNGVEVGRYDYDWQLQRTHRRTAEGTVDYVLDDKFVLNEFDGSPLASPAASRRYHYARQPVAVADSGGTRFLGVDALGSVTDETGGAGASVAKRQYDAWGQYRNGTAPTAAEPKLGFTGHQYDDETGLTYARARYYDARLGVFLSRDTNEGSLKDAPSLHRFAYARSNPTRYTDPDGRCPNCIAAGVGAVLGFGIGFGAALLDDKPWSEALAYGAGGAALGGLAGLTLGASLVAEGTVTLGTVLTTTGTATAKAVLGTGVDYERQQLAIASGRQEKLSYTELAGSLLGSLAFPVGKEAAALPSLTLGMKSLSAVLGSAGVAANGPEAITYAVNGEGYKALSATVDTGLSALGIAGGSSFGQQTPARQFTLSPKEMGLVALDHGSTLKRVTAIHANGPDPTFIEPGGEGLPPAESFSTARPTGPFPYGSPSAYAKMKAQLFPKEGGPAVLRTLVPESIVEKAFDETGEVRFAPGEGLEELLEAWPDLHKSIRQPK